MTCERRSRRGRAPSLSPQLVDNRLDERLMHVRRIAQLVHASLASAREHDICVTEDRRLQLPLRTGERDEVRFLRCVEVPDPGANRGAVELEGGRSAVFGGVCAAGVHGKTGHLRDRPDQEIQQIETVRCQVEEQSPAADGRVDTPPGVAPGEQRGGHLDVDGRQAPDPVLAQAVPDGEEPGQCPAVVRDPQGQPLRIEGLDHAETFLMVERHRLLDEARLAGGGHAEREIAVARGGGGDVDGVDVRVRDQIVRPVVRPRHTVAPRVVARLLPVAAHHRDQRGSFGLLKPGAALDFGDITAPDDAPANRAHMWTRYASSFLTTSPFTSVRRNSRP